MKNKIVFFSNTDWYLFNFRSELIRETMANLDCEPVAFVPSGAYVPALKEQGMIVIEAKLDNGSLNPLVDFVLFLQALWVFCVNRPILVHLFTIKCVLYGGVAARLLNIPRVSAITGLGHLFVSNSLKNRVLRKVIAPFYRFALSGSKSRVIFQNSEDLQVYIDLGFVKPENTTVIRGSGVNLEKFPEQPRTNNVLPTFLFIGRLIREKGVYQLISAIRILRDQGFEFEVRFAGDIYEGNPSSMTKSEVAALQEEPYFNFLGHVHNIQSEIRRADVVVLPSYREGTPKSLLEAAASGRAILCSEIAGNEGVVIPDVNGYFFPVGEDETLAEAMAMMIASPETIDRYAAASRAVVEKEFSTTVVVNKTTEVYRQLIGKFLPAPTPPAVYSGASIDGMVFQQKSTG